MRAIGTVLSIAAMCINIAASHFEVLCLAEGHITLEDSTAPCCKANGRDLRMARQTGDYRPADRKTNDPASPPCEGCLDIELSAGDALAGTTREDSAAPCPSQVPAPGPLSWIAPPASPVTSILNGRGRSSRVLSDLATVVLRC